MSEQVKPYQITTSGGGIRIKTPLQDSGKGYVLVHNVRRRALWKALWRGRLDIKVKVEFVDAVLFDFAQGHTTDRYRNGYYVLPD